MFLRKQAKLPSELPPDSENSGGDKFPLKCGKFGFSGGLSREHLPLREGVALQDSRKCGKFGFSGGLSRKHLPLREGVALQESRKCGKFGFSGGLSRKHLSLREGVALQESPIVRINENLPSHFI